MSELSDSTGASHRTVTRRGTRGTVMWIVGVLMLVIVGVILVAVLLVACQVATRRLGGRRGRGGGWPRAAASTDPVEIMDRRSSSTSEDATPRRIGPRW